ncbi:hypothetical protein HPB51_005275 [Rhipicephalus microplus]|uniref:Uncharacterized protein n=1 Tax=Rhipicephalus microplus TaxID=6941 RepID=A0A9J6DFP6_RHIMP|nr:hypothetical protein HPB51_005275 [Rhipicephalus microplus]
MSVSGLAPPLPFLPTPGRPAVAWPQWIRIFENFLLAAGVLVCAPDRRKALLIHSLSIEGQRIFHTLPLQSSANAKSGEPTTDTHSGDVKYSSQIHHEASSVRYRCRIAACALHDNNKCCGRTSPVR